MQNLFENYVQAISSKFSHQETSEMGYRTDFELLIKGIFEKIKVKRIDHDARTKDGNKPDFVVLNGEIPILYIEAKDIGVNLDKVEKSEQMARYFGYANLVLTDYTEFRFYRNGVSYGEPIKIADFDSKTRTITPIQENFELAAKTLIDFTQSHREPIKSGNHLAKIMGGKAQRIRDNLRYFLSIESEQNKEILRVYDAIKKMLVHDLTFDTFSDMYSQTLVYGLFVARYYDETPDTFSRQEARDLVPASNPFLQHFFDHIAGPNFDSRLKFIVDELCVVFQHANTKKLIEEYMGNRDPVIHFYEDFLQEYDSELRKKMGAYYTPFPVVKFIVRAIDDVLKNEFSLSAGIADTSKLADGKHKVQILDPAVGTGTFISEIIDQIHTGFKKRGQNGRWVSYVHHDLLPRLNGFELMMSPYTIAHLKISMKLQETGFKYFNETKTGKSRLKVYLTNSLENSAQQEEMFALDFGAAIAEESKEAGIIKNNTPIMIVVGNPPYSASSSNETEYANSLVEKYKTEPGGQTKLQERKHWLNDDYVKFIAKAEDFIARNGEGVLGFITNHGYLDNPTFRGMRWHLMKTFDKIYILDLHGNSKKKEISPDGSKDENIFDIQTGVSIIIGVKLMDNANEQAHVYHYQLWGKREEKFEELNRLSISNINWNKITPHAPGCLFVPEESAELFSEYQMGFSVDKLFKESSTGIFTLGDNFIIDHDKYSLKEKIQNFLSKEISEDYMKSEFDLGKNYAKWVINNKNKILFDESKIFPILYRPFDLRYTYFDNKLVWRPRTKIMTSFLTDKDNLGLAVGRQGQVVGSMDWNVVFITKNIIDLNCFYRGGEQVYPLYVIDKDGLLSTNLDEEILKNFKIVIGEITPEDVLYYVYCVLHSPSYRKKFKEFLKTDFPLISYPKNKETFKKLVSFGKELRHLHLLESQKINEFITTYPVAGSDVVEKITYKDGNVFINADQYFGNVPAIAWNFFIGGYQPAQKWLKDRKERALTNEDIEHYQKIIVVLMETDRIMKEIDQISL